MKEDFEYEWELQLDAELKGFPELEAPQALMEQVLSTIEERRQLVWYQRPYFSWPLVLRIAGLVLFVGLGLGLFGLVTMGASSEWLMGLKEECFSWASGIGTVLASLTSVFEVLSRSVLGFYAMTVLIATVVGIVALPFVMAGTAIVFMLSFVAVYGVVGRRFAQKSNVALATAIGGAIVTIAYALPIVGLFTFFAISVVGSGAVFLTITSGSLTAAPRGRLLFRRGRWT